MPMAWPTSTGWTAVAQQWVRSVHVSAVATEAWAGSVPPATQPCEETGDNVVTLPATTPSAVHLPAVRHSTAVTSVVPAGTVWSTQVDPPSVVVRTAPGPTPVWPTWPTAVHDRGV